MGIDFPLEITVITILIELPLGSTNDEPITKLNSGGNIIFWVANHEYIFSFPSSHANLPTILLSYDPDTLGIFSSELIDRIVFFYLNLIIFINF